MAQRSDILQTVEVMRENLREILKETFSPRSLSFEEEVLEGMENIDKRAAMLSDLSDKSKHPSDTTLHPRTSNINGS